MVTFDQDREDYAVHNCERTFQISAFYDIDFHRINYNFGKLDAKLHVLLKLKIYAYFSICRINLSIF